MRRSTWIYLLLLVGLAGFYYFLNNREQAADIAVTIEPGEVVSYLFSADEGIPSRIRIESKSGEIVELERDVDNVWALKLPFEASADQGSAEAAASQVTTMRILDTLAGIDLEVVGLKIPDYSITIEFTSGVERKADIGVITPTVSGYYVQNQDGKVVIVTKSSVDSLLTLLTNPPYLETPTPSPIPATETPVPFTPETGTVTAGNTPTP